jgi:Copper amine oxidase N-terminal domain
MANTLKKLQRTALLAGAAALSSGAFAFMFDANILIERALNSPTLTVKYDGANAALVELRVNGESFATRQVSNTASKGETTFTLTVTDLKDGENEIEIRLYDKTGKVIESQKQTMLTDQSNRGPVYISGPKQGQTLKGAVEIKLGFGKEMKNVFVSFYVDGDHKQMTNVPPFNYVWDTEKEANGWHTVEAWVVDETTNTYKSKQVRVFVNNPGGRTDRQGLGSTGEATVSKGTSQPGIDEGKSELKTGATTGASKPEGATKSNPLEPKAQSGTATPAQVKTTVNSVKPSVDLKTSSKGPAPKVADAPGMAKMPTLEGAVAMGNQDMIPTGLRVAGMKTISKVPNFVESAARKVLTVEHGTRFEGVTSFAVLFNNSFVEFDVQPRVDEGIPMTPFRHLLEKAGGDVEWLKDAKVVNASADGKKIWLKIGDKNAKINDRSFSLELAPYLDRGRTIVPLSFMKDALGVNIEFDPATGHVLITKN